MKRKETGITLVEMLAALVIAGILFAAAGPSIRGIFTSNRMATHLNQLSTAITFARSEAIKRVSPVAVGTTAGWAANWSIWVDNGANPGQYDAASETLLRNGTSTSSNITLVGTTTAIVYQPDGTIQVPSGGVLITPPADISFTLCYSGQTPRILTLTTTGRASVTTGASACP